VEAQVLSHDIEPGQREFPPEVSESSRGPVAVLSRPVDSHEQEVRRALIPADNRGCVVGTNTITVGLLHRHLKLQLSESLGDGSPHRTGVESLAHVFEAVLRQVAPKFRVAE
jgi:hypothetical protein